MALGKYYEDNLEVMYERLGTKQGYIQETQIKLAYDGNFPTVKLVVDVKNEVIVPEKKQYKDQNVICKDCGRSFTFIASAQAYYDHKGWDKPKRCKRCREHRNMRYLMCSSF